MLHDLLGSLMQVFCILTVWQNVVIMRMRVFWLLGIHFLLSQMTPPSCHMVKLFVGASWSP